MKNAVVFFLGEDRPGIMHKVSSALAGLGCNILEVSQTILHSEFAAILICAVPGNLGPDELGGRLEAEFLPLGITSAVREYRGSIGPRPPMGEPYVITVHGRDRLGMIAAFTGVLAGHAVNIINLKAIFRQDEPESVIIVFEVEAPPSVDMDGFRRALRGTAGELDLDVSVQHRDIFEAVHRL